MINNSSPDDGIGPVLDAVIRKSVSALKSALDRGGDVDERDPGGGTPINHAVIEGDADLLLELLKRGASVNASDAQGWTALHFAADGHRVREGHLLIEYGAPVDAPDHHGNTPLWRAVFAAKGNVEMIQLLLANGADKTRKNKHGVSPLELSETIGNYDVVQSLK